MLDDGFGVAPHINMSGLPVEQQKQSDDMAWYRTMGANRPSQSTDFANTNWGMDQNGQWHQTTSLNGALGDANTSLQQQYADALSKPLGTGDDARNQATNAAWNQSASRLNQQWDKRRNAQQTQLLNQGLDPSSEAYKSQMQDFGTQENDAYNSALNSAIGQGQQAGDLSLRDNMMARNSYLQGMQGLQGLTEAPRFDMASSAPSMDWMGAYGSDNKAWGDYQSQANQNSADTIGAWMGMLGNVAGAAIGACDERLKQKVQRLEAEALPGVPWATWEYKDAPGRRCFGVIAQDLERVAPKYVHRRADGMRLVDYRFLEAAKETP